MTKKMVARIILAIVIATVLGGASLIIAKSNVGIRPETPSGFFH